MDVMALLSAAKGTADMLKLGIDARDDAKVQAAMTDLNKQLFDLSMESLGAAQTLHQLQAAVSRLETEKRELEAKLKERSSYVLHKTTSGVLCYRFEPAEGSVEPMHYLCQPCYDKGVKSILRRSEDPYGGNDQLYCIENQSHLIYL